ncbi:hypothetical protein JF544_16420 [Halobacillus kuroshimensis]|uniref:PIN domain-containing protein n=1 Tax=Halobacillus kuroshimensis TaxID=302481 RepID=A0ABS3E090_9BACI|nr:hypothetical protein [Halobacillus kuroshimensis]MBN8236844.1 hypothetical protein [Halobacillus kuroshimensis]
MTRTSVAIDIHSQNWNNNNAFSQVVYIDTNAIIDIFEQRPNGQATEDYIKELVNQNGLIIWSDHTMDELTDFVHVNEYISYARANGVQRMGRKHPWKVAEDIVSDQQSANIASTVHTKMDQITTYLEQFGMQADVEFNKAKELTKEVHMHYGGNRKDSKHVAIANLNGVNDILTHDSGFLRYPVNVFGASAEIKNNYDPNMPHSQYVDLSESLLKKEDDEENTG